MSLNEEPNSRRIMSRLKILDDTTFSSVVLPLFSPSADDVGAPGDQLLVHPAEVAGIVLQVGVHRQDVSPGSPAEAAQERRRLAEVSSEGEDPDAFVRLREGLQLLELPSVDPSSTNTTS